MKPCVICEVDRAEDTLDDRGVCPFCMDKPLPLPPEPPEPPPPPQNYLTTPAPKKKPVYKHVEKEQPRQLEESVPYTPPTYTPSSSPEQELANRELARRRLLPFIQRFRPKYMPGWAHEDICRRLERFMKDVEEKKSPRLLIMLPPRFGKSEIGSRHFPPWVLGHHPDWEIIAASHTASLTLSFSRYIRDVMRDPGYKVVFTQAVLDPSSQSVENWNLTQGGGYLAAGVGTGITGRGAHILLLDDLVKDIEAADSQTITDNTWEWYGSTAYTRLAPGGGVLGIMTWWSEQDWAGRIQETMKTGEGDVFEIVKYPAINDDGDEYILLNDHIEQFPPDREPPPNARLTRKQGTAVHPDRYDTEAMLRIKRNLFATGQKRVWYALYQQDPLPDEGILFTKEMLRYGNYQRRSDWRAYQAWDFSITEKRMSDWISCTTGYVTPEDDIIIADVLRFKVDEDGMSLVEAMIDQYVAHECSEIGFEDGQIWKSIKTLFQKRCRERKVYPSYKVLAPITDKVVRSGPLRGRMQMGKVFIQKNRPWNEAFIKELTHFPGGKHDDMVDSTAWMVRLAMEHTPRSQRKMPEPKSWKDKLRTLGRGNGVSHMSA